MKAMQILKGDNDERVNMPVATSKGQGAVSLRMTFDFKQSNGMGSAAVGSHREIPDSFCPFTCNGNGN